MQAPFSLSCHIRCLRPRYWTQPTVSFLGWKLPGWIMALAAARTRLHANKCNFSGFCPRLGGLSKYKNIRKLVPAIFDLDATEHQVVFDVPKGR